MGKVFQFLKSKQAFTLIDVLVSVGILVVLFGGIYLIYFSVLDVISNLELRTAATSILNQEVEVMRNMRYEDVGTVGGVPSGLIAQNKIRTFGDLQFSVGTTIRNIDDPFDGTVGGNPNDTAPADYKLVEMEIDCVSCKKFVPLIFTTTVAPKSLESASNNGSLFINVFDAGGVGVNEATVRVVNNSVAPTIDLVDATNVDGVLQLVGVPTSTQGYQIEVSKTGYSSERTYSIGGVGNPNPSKPHATVAAQTVTSISFAIDRLSAINLVSLGFRCEAVPNIPFSIAGNKIIGTSPDVYKFSTTTATNSQGVRTLSSVEWDTYAVSMTSASWDVAGTSAFLPLTLNPDTTADLRFTLLPADPNSLLVNLRNASTGEGISGATVNISRSGFNASSTTGRAKYRDSDWSGAGYSAISGAIDSESLPGSVRLSVNASGTYDTSETSWLESETIDFGSTSTVFYGLDFSPTSQPVSTGAESLKFQIATNNDNATWNFTGPDGSAGSYYTSSGIDVLSGNDGARYLRYRVYLSTEDENETPRLDEVTLNFSGMCVPEGGVIFQNLSSGTYDITATATGFTPGTTTVSVSDDWQQEEILLQPN